MNFPILTSVILFIIILSFAIKRSSKDERALEEFLEKEAQANTTAKKDLDKLNYISVPAGFLSFLAAFVCEHSGFPSSPQSCLPSARPFLPSARP